ncbi:hypothetical protein ABB37_03618 [Leptomonas pyrrhocoris]|uniref:Uncharacterized protein n=1 Tax=Leptomonas pyrrhocoris TaxID=157538 RepID=A0A0M9G5B1_LEPPY|nr:hypothetical protein ABB37_03618 [Leptomonas pyrrhocoris]XP_015661032.1 hypothetical protein ABB37_03618 [Leptomonas pyrrhocoris]KPA82592.1 hypothetical protein ABB37_03618 [Leptomonas pyrrhocoris]KPA82593.1 hypothetical protein ABB37_03618 [Leptomonas pyrrhocoris]|eukprot:XP_015661031.1 hypothetical protein ABB37_03618 [Leptomonas pyrrhocoris]
MFTHADCDDVSSISAADLAQRLVEHSSRRRSAHPSATHGAVVREALPGRVKALIWDTKTSGGAAPRSALLRGDVVRVDAEDTGAVLLSLSLSTDVKFRFAQARQRRLLAVLSARSASSSLHLSAVDAAHFYWMDECAPSVFHSGYEGAFVLQKRLLRWALRAFAQNPLLKNIPMQSIEMAFPALLAYAPREREEVVKQAAEMLGRGTMIWYGGTLIKQFHDSSSLLLFPLLSPREERCAAALLFALANTHQIMPNQLVEASHAARYLVETYGTGHVALSSGLTQSLLTVASALTTLYPNTVTTGKTMQDVCAGCLSLLVQASAENVASFISSGEANPPPKVRGLLSQMRDLVRQTMCRSERLLLRNESAGNAQKEAEEDVNAFFADTAVLKVHRSTLRSLLAAGVDTQLPMSAATSSECASRLRLLEWGPKWWTSDTATRHAKAEAGETELKIDAKTAAAAMRESVAGDHALLAVIQRTRKRRRSDGVWLASQAVQTALEEAGIRLKRRTFLQLMDTLALRDGHKNSVDAATQFLQQQHVDALLIHRFTASFTAMQDK